MRNRADYTPLSAILRHANVDLNLRRPKGAKGNMRTGFMRPDDAAAVVLAAAKIDTEFALLLRSCSIADAVSAKR